MVISKQVTILNSNNLHTLLDDEHDMQDTAGEARTNS